MDWKLFWKVVRIGFGCIFLIAAVFMLIDSLFLSGIDIAYCMFAMFTLILGLIMVIFGISSLPKKE